MRLVPRGERRYHDARIGGDHRRIRSSVSRTSSDVRGGSFARGTATRDLPRPFKLIRVAGTSISRRPSLNSTSSSCPGRTPRASRSVFGTTSRPAASMVVLMAEFYHRKWYLGQYLRPSVVMAAGVATPRRWRCGRRFRRSGWPRTGWPFGRHSREVRRSTPHSWHHSDA